MTPSHFIKYRLATVKTHKATVIAKERELSAREAAFVEKESQMHAILCQKDADIASLQRHVVDSQSVIDTRIKEAIANREEELRVAVMKREEEVAVAMARREEEIMEAVRKREEEIFEAWRVREEQIRVEVGEAGEERMKWVKSREEELDAEQTRLDGVREELEVKFRLLDEGANGPFLASFTLLTFLIIFCPQDGKTKLLLRK